MNELFRRKYLISMFYLMVILVGVVAWHRIPVEMSPGINLPSITVTYYWSRTSPEVMEQEISRRVEQQVRRLRDVERVTSVSREGVSHVTIYFQKQAPVEYRMVELQEYLRVLESNLPPAVRPARISRRVPQELRELQTFLVYSISGEREPHELLELAERTIKLPLSGISGIAGIELSGVRDPTLLIELDIAAVERLGISVPMVMRQINDRLNHRSAGFHDASGIRYSMLVPPGLHSLDDIRSMPIPLSGIERRVRVGDIANVTISDYPERSSMRINGNPALTIRFERETGTDAMQLAETVIDRMDEIQSALPAGIHIQIERDATRELRKELALLERQAMISLICVFLVLLVFIRKVRAPLVILGSILFSLLFAVIMLQFLGYTINVITLAGLTIALGMIIDNAVVVFEHLNPGLPLSRRARIDHVRRRLPHVLVPVIGSTLTTVGIFVPLIFALDEIRMFLMPLGMALTLTLVSSVVISLSWIPYALIWLVRIPAPAAGSKPFKNTSDRFDQAAHDIPSNSISGKLHPNAGDALSGSISDGPGYDAGLTYRRNKPRRRTGRILLGMFLWRHRVRWLLYPALLLLIGVPLHLVSEPEPDEDGSTGPWQTISKPYFENRESIDPYIGGLSYRFSQQGRFGEGWAGLQEYDHISIWMRAPVGSPFEELDKIMRQFESLVEPFEHVVDYYESHVSELGSSARLQIYFPDGYQRQPEPYILFGRAAFLAARTGNVGISVSGYGESFWTGFGGGQQMSNAINLRGYSYEQLDETAREIRRRLQRHSRVTDVNINASPHSNIMGDQYHFVLTPDDDRLIQHGLTRRSVLEMLQIDINPEFSTFGRVTFDNRQMYLIASNRHDRAYKEQFRNVPRRLDGRMFTVDEIAALQRERALPEIRREDQMYTRVVSFDYLGTARLANAVRNDVIEGLPVPPGMTIERDTRNWFAAEDSDRQLIFVFLMAILSVWMIISALLERWRDPAVILLAIPLGGIGIMAGTLFLDLQFDRSAVAGALLVMGVVVNNAILLMHGRHRYRQLGIHGLRSWIYVYREKMRPVCITSFTTLAGLLPLVLMGDNMFWQNLATVVIWGLASSTLFLILMMGIWERPGLFRPFIPAGNSAR
ncbi:efflux RND transporter permease subunit [Balneolales bacterium ANBcel1]|nr:efflux RND transporter permease subunit [Balneolales bacterium ANBcel1]